MQLPNLIRFAVFEGGQILFSLDAPLGTPIPRVGDSVQFPTKTRLVKVLNLEYVYDTNIDGILVLIRAKVEYV